MHSIFTPKKKVAKSGECIEPSADDPTQVLKRNGIKVKGDYSAKDLRALALGVGQLEKLNGAPLPPEWQTEFNFLNQRGAWNQTVPRINVKKLSYGGDNVAALIHELGHKVANANGQKLYGLYSKNVKPCKISPYAQTKRSEEFAEAFSVLIVNPDDLKSKCPSAYNFFTQDVFKKSGDKVSEASCIKTAKADRENKDFQIIESTGTR